MHGFNSWHPYSSPSPNLEHFAARTQVEIQTQSHCPFSCPGFLCARTLWTGTWSAHLYVHIYSSFHACKCGTYHNWSWETRNYGEGNLKMPCIHHMTRKAKDKFICYFLLDQSFSWTQKGFRCRSQKMPWGHAWDEWRGDGGRLMKNRLIWGSSLWTCEDHSQGTVYELSQHGVGTWSMDGAMWGEFWELVRKLQENKSSDLCSFQTCVVIDMSSCVPPRCKQEWGYFRLLILLLLCKICFQACPVIEFLYDLTSCEFCSCDLA